MLRRHEGTLTFNERICGPFSVCLHLITKDTIAPWIDKMVRNEYICLLIFEEFEEIASNGSRSSLGVSFSLSSRWPQMPSNDEKNSPDDQITV